jgi:hypothetical protein
MTIQTFSKKKTVNYYANACSYLTYLAYDDPARLIFVPKAETELFQLRISATNQTINKLPTLAEWNQYELQLDNSGVAEPIELWCRNPVDALQSLRCYYHF